MKRVVEITSGHHGHHTVDKAVPSLTLQLRHDDRHVRRKVFELSDQSRVLIDLAESTILQSGQILVLDDGSGVSIEASKEDVYDVFPRDPVHLTELAWHIGNRHLAAEIHHDRIRILQDHVIKVMLLKLGAKVEETFGPFNPVRGAYSGGHQHHHGGGDKEVDEH